MSGLLHNSCKIGKRRNWEEKKKGGVIGGVGLKESQIFERVALSSRTSTRNDVRKLEVWEVEVNQKVKEHVSERTKKWN
jgi:hypothetical protein